jgi:hypothetical protein
MPATAAKKPRAVPPPPPPSGFATGQGAAAASGAALAVPGALAIAGAGALGKEATDAALDAAVGALRLFWTKARLQNEAWLLRTFKDAPVGDAQRAAADENEREYAFQQKAMVRFKAAMARALTETDPKTRNDKVKKAIAAEHRYAAMRQNEMGRRAVAAVDRAALRRESPQGGFWKLDLTKKTHTPECVAMAGKLWPWEALDRFSFWPPLGGGCGCSLYSYKTAVGSGWMKAGKVPNVEDAVRAVSRLTNLHTSEGDELELARERALLAHAGVMTAELFDDALRRLVEGELWPG